MEQNKTQIDDLNHSLIFKDACWSAYGYFQNSKAKTHLKGHLKVRAEQSSYHLDTTLFDASNNLLILERESHISVVSKVKMTWQDTFKAFGVLKGAFSIIDETLLLVLKDEHHDYQSFESLLKVFEDEYELRGVLFQAGTQIMTWRLELIRSNRPC